MNKIVWVWQISLALSMSLEEDKLGHLAANRGTVEHWIMEGKNVRKRTNFSYRRFKDNAALAGHNFGIDNVSGQGSKEMRAEPVSAAAMAGLIRILAGPWVAAFLTELEGFPKTTYKDQVDSLSGAFSKLANTVPGVWLNGERV